MTDLFTTHDARDAEAMRDLGRRVAELDRWRRSGEYERIIAGDYPRREDDANAKITEEIKAAANSYRESWAQSQDPFIGVLRDVAEGAVNAGERIFNRFARREN